MGYNNSAAIKAKLYADFQEVYVRVVSNITYILYQDLTYPKEVLIVKRDQVTTDVLEVTYCRKLVETTADVDDLITNITTHNYVNLLDINNEL